MSNNNLSPKEITARLDESIVGQSEAKEKSDRNAQPLQKNAAR